MTTPHLGLQSGYVLLKISEHTVDSAVRLLQLSGAWLHVRVAQIVLKDSLRRPDLRYSSCVGASR